jgi:hypothetical protein
MMMMMMILRPRKMMTTMMCPKCWYPAFIHQYDLQCASLFTQSNVSVDGITAGSACQVKNPTAQAAFLPLSYMWSFTFSFSNQNPACIMHMSPMCKCHLPCLLIFLDLIILILLAEECNHEGPHYTIVSKFLLLLSS